MITSKKTFCHTRISRKKQVLILLVVLVGGPFFLEVGGVVTSKELRLAVGLKRCPVTTDDAVAGDDGLEDAGFVVGTMAMLRG